MNQDQHNTANSSGVTPEVSTNSGTQTSTPSSTAPVTIDNNLLMGILCYLSILIIIPYLTAKDNEFVHYHLKQGFVLVSIEIALYVVGMIGMFYSLILILNLLNLGLLILSIIGIINVVQNKKAPLPLIGSWSLNINI